MICFNISHVKGVFFMKLKPVVGFANQKGGVGKTTWSKTFSEYVSMVKGKTTLGIDMDSQTSFTARFFDMYKNPVTDLREPPIHPYFDPSLTEGWDGKSSIADIFFGKIPRPYPTQIINLDVVPSDEGGLIKAENVKRQEMADRIYSQLHNFLVLEDVQANYDVFVVDTPPAKGPLTISSFKAMTHLVIPLEIEFQAIEGLAGILQLWKQESLCRPKDFPLTLVGILPNKLHSRRSSDNGLLEDLKKHPVHGGYVLPVQAVDRSEFPVCDLEKKSIFNFPDSNLAKREAVSICEYIFKEVFE